MIRFVQKISIEISLSFFLFFLFFVSHIKFFKRITFQRVEQFAKHGRSKITQAENSAASNSVSNSASLLHATCKYETNIIAEFEFIYRQNLYVFFAPCSLPLREKITLPFVFAHILIGRHIQFVSSRSRGDINRPRFVEESVHFQNSFSSCTLKIDNIKKV